MPAPQPWFIRLKFPSKVYLKSRYETLKVREASLLGFLKKIQIIFNLHGCDDEPSVDDELGQAGRPVVAVTPVYHQ